MLNKKILAAAVASAFSLNAFATEINTTDTVADSIQIATETFTAADYNADGLLPVDNETGANPNLNVIVALGFTIAENTSKYLRFDLDNGSEFNVAPTLSGTNVDATISAGGAGESFVIFEVTPDPTFNLASGLAITLEVDDAGAGADYNFAPNVTTSVSYSLYEEAAQAVNQTAGTVLASASEAMVTFGSANTGSFATAGSTIATVGSNFTTFDADEDGTAETFGIIGTINSSAILQAGSFTPDGIAVTLADLITATTTVTLSGDVSFGDWYLSAAPADCVAVTQDLVEAADGASATTGAFDTSAATLNICVDNSGATPDTIAKGSYTIELDTDELTNAAGSIVYNTTSIEIPYVTTFASYNQRIYLVNNGIQDATYTTSFTAEDGVTFVAGSAASGVVPAGEVLAINASDFVTLSGKTRVSAIIEIEAEDDDVQAATQTVNLGDGTTDTVVLN